MYLSQPVALSLGGGSGRERCGGRQDPHQGHSARVVNK